MLRRQRERDEERQYGTPPARYDTWSPRFSPVHSLYGGSLSEDDDRSVDDLDLVMMQLDYEARREEARREARQNAEELAEVRWNAAVRRLIVCSGVFPTTSRTHLYVVPTLQHYDTESICVVHFHVYGSRKTLSSFVGIGPAKVIN